MNYKRKLKKKKKKKKKKKEKSLYFTARYKIKQFNTDLMMMMSSGYCYNSLVTVIKSS